MYSSRNLFSILVVCFLVTALIFGNTLNNPINAEGIIDPGAYQAAIEYRELHGFNTDKVYVEKIFKEEIDLNVEQVLGFPLTQSELTTLTFRQKVIDSLPELKSFIEINNISYGGIYYNSKEGNAVVNLVNIEQEEFIRNSFKYPNNIVFKPVQFNETELESARDILRDNSEKLSSLLVTSWGIDVKTNKLVITMSTINDEARKFINSIIHPRYVEFKTGKAQFALYEDDLKGEYDLAYGGLKITNSSWACSVGFHAKDASNNYVLVTAGHCDTTSSTSTWHQPKYDAWYDTNTLGKWTKRTSGTTNADAGYIKLSDTSYKTEKVYPGVQIFSVESTSEEFVGMSVCRIGQITGQRCGDFLGTSDLNVYDKEYTILTDQRMTNAYAEQGDSGGTFFRIYYGENDTQEYKLVGVTSATLNFNDGSTGSSYSHVRHMLSGLGLSGSKVLTKSFN